MKTVLFIDGCIRGKNSRTQKIADTYIQELKKQGDFNLIIKDLDSEDLEYSKKDSFDETGKPNISSKALAEEFANADEIILAAPFWEFIFPAIVSCYIEKVSVVGTTFVYSPEGSVGLCKAKSFKYIYTAGNYLTEEDKLSEKYLKRLTELYGIDEFSAILVDGLDIQTNDAEALVNDMCEKIKNNLG